MFDWQKMVEIIVLINALHTTLKKYINCSHLGLVRTPQLKKNWTNQICIDEY